jgi:hypothetical protein
MAVSGSGTGTPATSSGVIEELIPYVRVKIGDFSSPYRYESDWIRSAIRAASITLQQYLHNKYLLDEDTDDIIRNTEYSPWYYAESQSGVLEYQDKNLYIVMSAIIMLQGDLENNAWNLASWKDFEISYTNMESGRTQSKILDNLWNELYSLITPPTKRLAQPRKSSLPGFLRNRYETNTKI